MSRLTWLHISDWHQEGKISSAKVVCDELVKDISNRAKISTDLETIDFIIFSGDVAQTGKSEQYDDPFKRFFIPILEASKISPEFLFIVPGNHDLDRGAIHPDIPKTMRSNAEVDSWWDENEKRSRILQPFQTFNDFKRNLLGQTPTEYAETRLWKIDQKKIALLGINSAWMCGRHKDEDGIVIDQGNLCIAEPQIYEPLKQISEADIKIAVLHHPLDWLTPFDLSRVELHLKKNCRFILHGHGHKPGVSANKDTFGYHIAIPAGACYDRRNPTDSAYVFSYNYVHLDFDKDEGVVFLRRWSEKNRTWWKDDETYPPDGMFSFSILGPGIPHQIPFPRADFTGRDEELNELLNNFEQGVIIAGIRGLGGIGKTELAVKLAQELKERYPDGQIFVEMGGTSKKPLTPAEAMSKVIYAYDRQAALPDDYAELGKLYRQKLYGKRTLLLLDNASDDHQIRPLVPPPTCGLIVTSRLEFTLDEMKAINLGELPPERAAELLQKIVRTSRPLEAEQCEEPVWRKIARLCGHLPLALRAAGSMIANTRDLSPAKYADELQDEHTRLERIGDQGVNLDVEASFKLSYSHLPQETARIFSLLSVFASDFDAQAEEMVCEDKGHRHLSKLMRLSLVEFQAENNRYHLHDLVRIFATSRLESSAKDMALMRHAEYYRNMLSESNELYKQGGNKVLAGLQLFDLEEANILSGQAWAGKNLGSNSSAAELCKSYPDSGFYVLDLRLHPQQKIAWLEKGVKAAIRLKDKMLEGVHLGNLGQVFLLLGKTDESFEYTGRALVIGREIGDKKNEGTWLSNLGFAYDSLGETSQAIEYYELALAIAREIGDRRNEGIILGNLGHVYHTLGEMSQTIGYCDQALAIAREIGDRRNEGSSLDYLGIIYIDLGDVSKAIDHLGQALKIAIELGDKRGKAARLCNLGLAYDAIGKVGGAIEYFYQALAIAREIGDKSNEVIVLRNLGHAYFTLGETSQAIEYCDQALAIAREIGDRRSEGIILRNLSHAYHTR